ncbi:MAG: hypothetical protein MUF00_20705 [Gemmatimonadaceae bacterium]|jgi:hypothetical protein|nr:hypothetical protein [Gemmatimonadaceae bacterium]
MMARVVLALLGGVVACAPRTVCAQGAGATHLVVITGVSGEARIKTEWHGIATAIATAATTRLGLASSRVTVLDEDSTAATGWMSGRSNRAGIERTLGALARSLSAADRLVIVIMAHGSSLSGPTRVNLPGPDMTPADFARVLAPATAPELAVIHTGSASAEFATALGGPRRIVITATKSEREQNETLFPGPFTRAITTDAGDADKDGRVSLLEAFTFAKQEVEQVFAKGNLLPTEHPVLTDGAEGGRARGFFLADARATSSSASAAALEARAAVQARLDALRARRGTMSEDEYLQALEPLILELIERTRALREGKP